MEFRKHVIQKFLASFYLEKKVVKDSVMIFSSTIVGGIFGFSFNVLLSRTLGPENFGLFKTITALFGTIMILFDFGLQNTLTKYTSEFSTKGQKEKIKHLTQNLFLYRLIALIFIIFFSLALKEEIAITFLKSEQSAYLIFPGLIFAVLVFIDISRSIIIGFQNFRLISVENILVPLLNIFIVIPIAIFFGLPYAIIAAGFVYILGSLFSILFIFKKGIFKKTARSILVMPKLIFSYGLPSYFSNLPTYVSLAIIPIVSVFFDQTRVGYFSFAFSFYAIAMMIPVITSQILFPKFVSLSVKSPMRTKSALVQVLKFYTLVAFVEIAFSPLLINPLVKILAPNFVEATNLVIVLVATGAILGFFMLLITYFTALHKLKVAFLLNFSASLIFVFISLTAIKILL